MDRRAKRVAFLAILSLVVWTKGVCAAESGVSDTEIVLGATNALTGPMSMYATTSRLESAYFEMINAEGGIAGRKVRLITLDDGFSPPKTVERTRKLVEQEGVFAVISSNGTSTSHQRSRAEVS